MRAGARFDGAHPGIAHMAEHMLFQGTATLDQVALNRRAAELGGEHNADTGYETISLTFKVFNEDVDDALGLLAEQFYHSQVSEERLRKERRVVMDEIRGLIRVNPIVGWGLMIGSLAILGMPPFGVFASEFLILTTAMRQFPWTTPLLLLALGVAFAAVLSKVQPMVFGETNVKPPPGDRLFSPPAVVAVCITPGYRWGSPTHSSLDAQSSPLAF